MSNTYFTVTGLHHYYGDSFLEKDNEYDREAIGVNLAGLGESYSAGRLYDKISEEASGKVKFILDKGVICEFIE